MCTDVTPWGCGKVVVIVDPGNWTRKSGSVSGNRKVTGVNQLWETDIKYGYIPEER